MGNIEERSKRIKAILDGITGLRQGLCPCGYMGVIENGTFWKCGTEWGINPIPRTPQAEGPARNEPEQSTSLGSPSGVAEAAKRVKVLVERSMAKFGADQMGGLERDAITLALAALQATPQEGPLPPHMLAFHDEDPWRQRDDLARDVLGLVAERDALRAKVESLEEYKAASLEYTSGLEEYARGLEAKLRALEGAARDVLDCPLFVEPGTNPKICTLSVGLGRIEVLRALAEPHPTKGEETPREESPTGGTAIRPLLCRAAIRGWRRGRRNQDPAQEEIADDLLLEAEAAPEGVADA